MRTHGPHAEIPVGPGCIVCGVVEGCIVRIVALRVGLQKDASREVELGGGGFLDVVPPEILWRKMVLGCIKNVDLHDPNLLEQAARP